MRASEGPMQGCSLRAGPGREVLRLQQRPRIVLEAQPRDACRQAARVAVVQRRRCLREDGPYVSRLAGTAYCAGSLRVSH